MVGQRQPHANAGEVELADVARRQLRLHEGAAAIERGALDKAKDAVDFRHWYCGEVFRQKREDRDLVGFGAG